MEEGKDIRKYKNFDNVGPAERYEIVVAYIKMKESVNDIAAKYSIRPDTIESFISLLYKRLQQSKETRVLLYTQKDPALFQVMRAKYVESEHINRLFLEKLSEPEDLVLSDSEILFCEYCNEYGDEVKALEKAKLHVGLTKGHALMEQYREACTLRALYLKRKPNVANYMNECKKRVLKELDNGKEFLQENLITLISQLKNKNNPKDTTYILKALETLGRTIGAFDDKLTLQSVDGDKVLDDMLQRARASQASRDTEELQDTRAYVDDKILYN